MQVGAHPLEIKDRDHLVQLLHQGSASLPPMTAAASSNKTNNNNHKNNNTGNGGGGGGLRLSSSTEKMKAGKEEEEGEEGDDDDENNGDGGGGGGGGSGAVPTSRVGAGAAAKGRAGATLPPGFAAARAGDLEGLKKLVEGGEKWDPRVAVDRNGSSPLDWAAGEGRIEVCRWVGGWVGWWMGGWARGCAAGGWVVGVGVLFCEAGMGGGSSCVEQGLGGRFGCVVRWARFGGNDGSLLVREGLFSRRHNSTSATAGFHFSLQGLGLFFRLASNRAAGIRNLMLFLWNSGIMAGRAGRGQEAGSDSGTRAPDPRVWLIQNPLDRQRRQS